MLNPLDEFHSFAVPKVTCFPDAVQREAVHR
jgi:hypothetical protein